MKGREARGLLKVIENCDNCGCESCNHELVYAIDEFLTKTGWIPPGEGVRLDKVVEGMHYCDAAHMNPCSRKFKGLCISEDFVDCYKRPATVADLTGGSDGQ